jgi:hypothetical protein
MAMTTDLLGEPEVAHGELSPIKTYTWILERPDGTKVFVKLLKEDDGQFTRAAFEYEPISKEKQVQERKEQVDKGRKGVGDL